MAFRPAILWNSPPKEPTEFKDDERLIVIEKPGKSPKVNNAKEKCDN